MRTIKKVIIFLFISAYIGLSHSQAQEPSKIVQTSSKTSSDALPQIASGSKPFAINKQHVEAFSSIYKDEIKPLEVCPRAQPDRVQICSSSFRNDGNGPYMLAPETTPQGVIVLFHGLSDSPFFMASIAQELQNDGYLVIAPLTPGHGKKDADFDMQDERLLSRWYAHIDKVMAFASSLELPVIVGGFSTGGTFATHYAIHHPEKVNALLLFSGALQLSKSAEAMSNIWGIKSLAVWLDGEYQTDGGHPYKYPTVASYSGLVLMDLIKDIRAKLEKDQDINIPIFAAHSLADRVTLFGGIEHLTQAIDGNHTLFKIDESYDLCHADLPMSNIQLVTLDFDKSKVNINERCAVPKANPVHDQMMLMLKVFLSEHV